MTTRRRRPRTFDEAYSPEYLAGLDSMHCTHDDPRGPRYCALCRRAYHALRNGALITPWMGAS